MSDMTSACKLIWPTRSSLEHKTGGHCVCVWTRVHLHYFCRVAWCTWSGTVNRQNTDMGNPKAPLHVTIFLCKNLKSRAGVLRVCTKS